MSSTFWRTLADGVEVAVRATPKGGRDAIEGVMTDASGAHWLAVRVSVTPDGGKANDAVCKLLAFHFGVRGRDVTLASGATGRLKRIRISGDPAKLSAVAAGFQQEG